MKTIHKTLMASALAAAFVGLSATAIAQGMGQHQGMSPDAHAHQHMAQRGQGPMVGGPGPHRGGDQAQHMAQMLKRHSEHQAQLKSALKLTASQEAAWNAYVASTAPNPPANAPGMAKEDLSKLTTPQRMDKMQAHHAERSAAMSKRIEAVKTLYAALTPEQQKVFDTQAHGGFQRAGMRGEHRMGGHGGHHGMGMHRGGMHTGGMGCDGPKHN